MSEYEIKGVLFDKNGTLINFDKTWFPIYNTVASEMAKGDMEKVIPMLSAIGIDYDDEICTAGSLSTIGDAFMIMQVWGDILGDNNHYEMEQYFNSRASQLLPETLVEITNTRNVFEQLKDMDIAVGIATCSSTAVLDASLDTMELGDDNEIFKCAYDSGYGQKPERGMVDGFADFNHIDNDQVMVVGDNLSDMAMALNADAGACVGVLSGNGNTDDLVDANCIVDTIDDIAELIEQEYSI
ncbi:MAG: HAD family hydrolase [Alphaproteobacteria bacterium]